MNAIGIALVWCIVQVTLLGLLSGALYLIVQKIRPGAGAPVALTGLLAVVVLSALALSPWPRWSLSLPAPPSAVADGNVAQPPSAVGAPNDSIAPTADPSPQGRAAGARDSVVLTAAALWRGFLDELSPSQPASARAAWAWPAAIAVVVLAGMAGGLIWLVLGVLAVRWHRARSRPVEDADLLALVNQLRTELGCRRHVELRESDDLVTAATIGWRRPCILLPRDWAAWTADQRRAVLAHEMAHVRRNDFLAVLAGQLGVVLHFYHPLLHWLMGRLRLEQELAADAAAAGVSGGQRKYLVTIAELALRQQDRPLAWPARTFLPTRTTFLRRITMLRDSRLRFERLSTPLRVLVVAAVAACGLLVAGLRSPGASAPALADDPARVASAAAEDRAKLDAAADSIDTTFLTENAASFVVVRPQAAFARPELADLARLLDESANMGLKPHRLSEMRQITMILPEPAAPQGPREVVVFQSTKPLPVEPRPNATIKDYQGKKMYVFSGGGVVLQCDQHTVIEARSEEGMAGYLSGKRGVLPKWLPAKEWESFRGDHFVMAADAAMMRREMETVERHAPPIVRAGLATFAPLWEDTAWLAAGARLGDRLEVHALVAGKNADSAVKVQRTVEAIKVLAQNAAKNLRPQAQAVPEPGRAAALGLLDAADRMLDNLVLRQEGNGVQLETSVELEKAGLDVVVQSIIASRKAAVRSQSMNNLKQIAIGMHNYHDIYKRFPPAVLYGPDGKTPYSWRVALLPYLEQNDLYKRYRFDEPWDGPNNRKLLAQIPSVYRSPADAPASNNASYFALVGPGTVFGSKEGTSFRDITDGASQTILLVEAKRDIPWTKPEDIPFDPDKPVPPLGGFSKGMFLAAFCDAHVQVLRTDIPQDILRLLIIQDDGQAIDLDKIR